MKHTEFGHSVYFISQNWGSYPNFSTQNIEALYTGSTFSNGIPKNTWEDWHLIPASRPTLPFPNQKTRTIDSIPNINGNIDLSWSDVPYPVFENREDTFEFIYNPLYDDTHKDWTELYSEIASFIHGRHLRMVLEDDPGYYYEGRFHVEKWTSNTDGSGSTITIGYSVQPYKLSLTNSLDEWFWDPFSFYSGVVSDSVFKNITVSGYDGHNKNDIPRTENPHCTWNKIELFRYAGDMPQIPIVYWKPNSESSDKKLIVDYVNKSYGIDYADPTRIVLNSEKYKYYDPNKRFNSDAVTLIGPETIDGDVWYKFKDNDLIFCDAYMGEEQYIAFAGNGTIKIEFRRGRL